MEIFNFMNFYNYFKIILREIVDFDNKAINPFINKNFNYNPFKNAFNQTYVWIEKEKDNKCNI